MADQTILTEYRRPTLIEVMAPHCVECRAMEPDLDAVSVEQVDSVDLVVIDATRETEQAKALGVLGTPTLIAVRGGAEVARFTGRRSRRELTELFQELAAGDPASLPAVSRSDQMVWSLAGAALFGVGLLVGPSWLLVALGVAAAAWGARPTLQRWARAKS